MGCHACVNLSFNRRKGWKKTPSPLSDFHHALTLYLMLLQQSNLKAFKTAILAKASDNQLVEVWLKLLNQLIEDLER